MESSLHSLIFLGLLATILVTTHGQGEYVYTHCFFCQWLKNSSDISDLIWGHV